MDLNSLKLSTSTTVAIVHPETLGPTDIKITIASPDSDVVTRFRHDVADRRISAMASGRKQKMVVPKADELAEQQLSELVAA